MRATAASPLQRMLLISGAALLLPVFVVLALLLRDTYQERRAEVEQAALALARELVALSDAQLEGDLQVLRVLAASPSLAAGDLDAARWRADDLLELSAGWTAVTLRDAAGKAVLRVGLTSDVAGPEAAAPAPDGEPATSAASAPPLEGTIDGVERNGLGCPCIRLRVPVRDLPGHVIEGQMDPAVFQERLMERAPPDVVAAIVDRQGLFIARTLDHAERVGSPATQYVRDAVAAGGEGLYEGRTYEGLVNVSAYATSDRTGWSAHVAIDRALITTPQARATATAIIGSIGALALAGLLVGLALRDLALRRREEARLMEMQKAETIGRFTSTVVHDFRNLLAVMQASLNRIARQTREPKTRETVAMANEALERGGRLVNQLLDFARHDGTGVAPMDLGALIGDIDSILREAVGRGVTLDVTVAPDARAVTANADQLGLALVNLAVNARDAMEGTGAVTIAATRAGDVVEVRVADNGPGFPPEVLSQTFQPFFTTKPPGKGTGLGLTQVAGAVRQAGGGVEARNRPGGGGEVILRLLAVQAAPEAAAG